MTEKDDESPIVLPGTDEGEKPFARPATGGATSTAERNTRSSATGFPVRMSAVMPIATM